MASQSAPGAALAEEILNVLAPEGGIELSRMGEEKNWDVLETRLEQSGLENMWITDEATESCFKIVVDKIESSKFDSGKGILHSLLRYDGGDNGDLLCRLLALGLEPDLEERNFGTRPIHCCCWGPPRLDCAEALCFCRADFKAKVQHGETPTSIIERSLWKKPYPYQGQKEEAEKILAFFAKLAEDGYPSLARLAHDKKWFAVKSLCRRGVVDLKEIVCLYKGKDTVEWAKFHGEHHLAREIAYLFKYPESELELAHLTQPEMLAAIDGLFAGLRNEAVWSGLEGDLLYELLHVKKNLVVKSAPSGGT